MSRKAIICIQFDQVLMSFHLSVLLIKDTESRVFPYMLKRMRLICLASHRGYTASMDTSQTRLVGDDTETTFIRQNFQVL